MDALKEEYKDVSIEEDIVVNGCNNKVKKHNLKEINAEKRGWNQKLINVDEIMEDKEKDFVDECFYDNKKVKVAIIDSGIDSSSDVSVAKSINMVPGEEELTTFFEDTSGHGTSIAGIIAAKDDEVGITGINPNVLIYSAKVFDSTNSAPLSRILEGIYWAIDEKVDIINMSFGIPEDSIALKEAIDTACEAGILVVAAAGNGGNDSDVLFPAAYDNVLGVGSVDSNAEISEFTSTGKGLDIMAPGENIISSSMLEGVVVCEGTSMSVPHVVGVASLIKEKDKTKDGKFIKELLINSANKSGEFGENGIGIVDAQYALEIYDEFAYNYINYINENYENNSILEKTECEELVVGQWGNDSKGHGDIAVEAYDSLGYYPMTADEKKALKLGAAFNDKYYDSTSIASLGGLHNTKKGDNGDWHGNYKAEYDYVSAYMYMACLANTCYKVTYNGKELLKPRFSLLYDNRDTVLGATLKNYITKSQYNRMRGRLNAVWSVIRSELINNNIPYEAQRYFYIGMTLHIVADIYAHSTYAYMTINNVADWYFLIHGSDSTSASDLPRCKADDYSFRKKRRKSAVKVCSNVLALATNGYSPKASVFALSKEYYDPNNSEGFCVRELYERVITKGAASSISKELHNLLFNVTENPSASLYAEYFKYK